MTNNKPPDRVKKMKKMFIKPNNKKLLRNPLNLQHPLQIKMMIA